MLVGPESLDYSSKMIGPNLDFITCEQLRDELASCHEQPYKRILIIDTRDPNLFQQSHLTLDPRNQDIKQQLRVINVDPDVVGICIPSNIEKILSPAELKAFQKRKTANVVVLIDKTNTNDLSDKNSKVNLLLKGLTKWDTGEDKIQVPIKVLKGGYKEWWYKYPHFASNMNPQFHPDADQNNWLPEPPTSSPPPEPALDTNGESRILVPSAPPIQPTPSTIVSASSYVPSSPIQSQVLKPPAITKPVPVPSRPLPTGPKPHIIKNAPGTAVFVKPTVPTRYKSDLDNNKQIPLASQLPDFPKAEGDGLSRIETLDNLIGDVVRLQLTNNTNSDVTQNNNNNINDYTNNYSNNSHQSVPKVNRNLKPASSIESIHGEVFQLDFGPCLPNPSIKSISGLQNLGNTCFMNSVIQCLAYAPTFATYFNSNSYRKLITKSRAELTYQFGALMQRLSSLEFSDTEPISFRDAVTKHLGFPRNEQQDSHEFMIKLFDKLHHDLNKKQEIDKRFQNGNVSQNGNSNSESNINVSRRELGEKFWRKQLEEKGESIVSESFEGVFMHTLTYACCQAESNTFEMFNCLSLPIPSESRCDLQRCLMHFFNPELIEEELDCPRCKQKRRGAKKKIVICRLPRILIIHLKRFSSSSIQSPSPTKTNTTVNFPLTRLVVDCTPVLPPHKSDPSRCSYNLHAVVNHYGQLTNGHYTAFAKLENQKLYRFDDSKVTEIRESDVCGQAGYILFYVNSN